MAKTQNEQRVLLFTPWQIYVASCLGSPLAATWLTVRNHQALQQPNQVGRAVWLGLVATIIIIALAPVLPSTMPVAVWPFLYSIGSYFCARRVFGVGIVHEITKVGRRGAWWRVVLISFGFFFVLVGVMAALALTFPGLFPSGSQPTS